MVVWETGLHSRRITKARRSQKTKIHPSYRHHDSLANLIATGKDGCELCLLLEQAVTAQINDRDTKVDDNNILSIPIKETIPMYIRASSFFVSYDLLTH
jgi:hypothetical protein